MLQLEYLHVTFFLCASRTIVYRKRMHLSDSSFRTACRELHWIYSILDQRTTLIMIQKKILEHHENTSLCKQHEKRYGTSQKMFASLVTWKIWYERKNSNSVIMKMHILCKHLQHSFKLCFRLLLEIQCDRCALSRCGCLRHSWWARALVQKTLR